MPETELPQLLADIVSWDKVMPFAVFGAFAAAAWWLLDMLATSKPRAEERLEEFKNPRARRRDGDDGPTKKSATMTKMLAAASPALAKPLQPKNEVEVGKLKNKLTQAGFRNETAVTVFLGLKFAMLLVGVVLGGGAVMLSSGVNQKSLINTVAVAGIVLFYLPGLVLWFPRQAAAETVFFSGYPTRST